MQTKNNISELIEYDITLFKLTNPTSSDVNVDLFDVNGAEIPNTPINELGDLQFYITGDDNYNSFVRDTFINPKNLQRIKMFVQTEDDFNNNLQLTRRDATGTSCEVYNCPAESLFVEQRQNKVAQIEIDNFKLDQSSFINYTIPANTTIKWLMYYQEFKLSSMLPNRYKINNAPEYTALKPMTYTEQQLKDTVIKNNWADIMETNQIRE